MPKFYYFLTTLLATLLFSTSFSMPVQAEDNNQKLLQEQIKTFKHGENHRFAPQTLERAEAYMGAAMLASEQEKQQEVDAALAKAAEKLSEARHTAADFKQHFSKLLGLRKGAVAITEIITSSGKAISDLSPTQIIKDAERELTLAIETHERGELNQTRIHADKATKYYRQVLDKTLPWLTELTASTIGKAANANARQYAPHIYQAAKDKLAELEAFINGRTHTVPEYPESGLYLAREAEHVAQQVKAWRRKRSSHEELILKTRTLKLQLARELGISNESSPMLTDIETRDLLRAVKKLNKELADERKAHRLDMARLGTELQNKLTAQTDEMKQEQQNQLSTIKEAFKAKLERETFEKKRQQRLQKLFRQGEAEILVNLDGSLLIRLTGLKFHSGRSKVSSKYFDLLGRLKQAMDIYQDRSLRIEGHTDDRGDVKPNQVLSLKRAEAVRDFLIAAGADGTRLKALGYGEVRPIASNEFTQGRDMNRRIDVIINAPK